MQRYVPLIAASALIAALGVTAARAQEYPEYQMREQSQIQQQRRELERQLERAQSPRPRLEDDVDLDDDSYSRGMMGRGWRYHQDWRRGVVGPSMGQPGMMGPGNMAPGMMMRMIFTLMDSDGDGSLSLDEFQAAHARIFKGMDANKDGRLTMEEMQAFMQGARRSAPRQ
jgi:hypothetical protein